eukprot:12237658-Ditylum_brightwellii.AAC.1
MARLQEWEALLTGFASAPLHDLQRALAALKSSNPAMWAQCIVQCQHFAVAQALLTSRNHHTTQWLVTLCREMRGNDM